MPTRAAVSGAVELEAELRACSRCFENRQSRCSYAYCPWDVDERDQTIATLRSDNERLGRERDEARAEVARYWTSADMKPWVDLAESKGLGHFGKKLKGMFSRAIAAEDQARQSWEAQEAAEAERDTLLAQVAGMRAERDELDFLYHEGGTMEAQLAAAEAERDAAEASLATMRDALTEAVRLYETYGMLAQDAACGKWVNSARAALTKEPS